MSLTQRTNKSGPGNLVSERQTGRRSTLQLLSVLFKTRVVSLLLLAATGGAFLGAGGWPGLTSIIVVLVAGGLAASGAAGLNEYLEQGTDSLMNRTRKRPLVTGELQSRWILWACMGMILIPSLIILPFNPALSFFLVLGALIYVGIYTVWLKPRTLLNIVIGGAAGSAAVLSGGAAAGAWQDPAVIALALLVFVWTPSHFWSLAILYRNDYARASVPMLPVQTTPQTSSLWVLLHTGTAGLIALLLAFTPQLGFAYLIPVLIVTTDIFIRNFRLVRDPSTRHARSLFVSSNIFLMVVLLSVCAGSVLHSIWTPA
jgi:protoheme IX farnesyltransferase